MNAAINLRNVGKKYPNGKGIKSVNLTVGTGQIFGFLGPNGAGKTTTIRTLMGFMQPDKGTIEILGLDASKDSMTIKQRVGYVPADRQLYPNWTGHQHLEFYQSSRPRGDFNIAKRLGLDLTLQVKHLSTGNKQKLALTVAMIGNPQLLIMDEPTSGLDPLLQQDMYEVLREYKQAGGTVFLSSHNLSEVEKICDSVAVIKDGRIVADKSMQDIRDMSIHMVSVVTERPLVLPVNLANIEIISQAETHANLRVKGELGPLLGFLARRRVHDLEITHASLEDVFLEFYS